MRYFDLNISPKEMQTDYFRVPRGLNALMQQNYQTQIMPDMLQAQLAQQLLKNQGMGIENQYLPDKLRLANQMAQQQNQWYGPQQQSEIGLRGAQASHLNAQIPLVQAQAQVERFKAQNPGMDLSGPAGQVAFLKYLQGQPNTPENTQLQETLKTGIQNMMNNQMANAQYKMFRTTPIANMTADQKENFYGYTRAMGMSDDQAFKLSKQGYNLGDIAQMKGADINALEPKYVATSQTRSNIQMRQSANAEINALSNRVIQGISPYSRTWLGYSPKQAWQNIKDQNPDQQAQFLASYALMPELNAARGRAAAGGRIGVETIREIGDATYGRMKPFREFGVSPEVFEKSQRLIDQYITEAVDSANNRVSNSGGFGQVTKMQKSPQQNLGQQITNKMPNPSPNFLQASAPKGQIKVYDTKSGQFGFIKPSEMSDQYMRIK